MILSKTNLSKKIGVAIAATTIILAPFKTTNFSQPIHGFATEKSKVPTRPTVTEINYNPNYWGVVVPMMHANQNMNVCINYSRDNAGYAYYVRTDSAGNASFETWKSFQIFRSLKI
ncbi:hypothetical protein [Listeria rocourtiae]|uniref:hypothetical protein n=1 Tax=Listeria rocourtiae TaxID=647910 RepID=UPI003D2F92A3